MAVNTAATASTPTASPADVPAIFNATLTAQVVFALADNGLDTALARGTTLDELASDPHTRQVLLTCLRVLDDHGAVRWDDEHVVLTDAGRELFAAKGFFVWLLGGYTRTLEQLPAAVAGHRPRVERDRRQVAVGSGLVDDALMRDQVAGVLAQHRPRHVADLGCGGGSRLLEYLTGQPTARGLGVELSAEAVTLAADRAEERGLSDRMTVLEADCLAPLADPTLGADVDCVMSFFLLHDLLAARGGDMAAVLAAIRHNYPAAGTLLVADTSDDDWPGRFPAPPVFTRGFELVHALMGIPLRSRRAYEDAFEASDAKLVETIPLGVPNSWLFHVAL